MAGRTIPVYLYVGSPVEQEKNVWGCASPQESTVHISMRAIVEGAAVSTLLHEVAHVTSCASDLGDTFEHELGEVGVALAKIVRRRGAWWDGLLDTLARLRDEPLGYWAIKGKMKVDRESHMVSRLASLLDEYGFMFFAGQNLPLSGLVASSMSGAALSATARRLGR